MSVLPPGLVGTQLPAGKACRDCVHFARKCTWLLSRDAGATECEWLPSKFLDVADYDEVEEGGRRILRLRAR